jgi:peptidyl-prolyl cis-trans isomerase A (cyclophilin A)
MKKALLLLLAALSIILIYGNHAVAAENPRVIFSTTKGDLTIELYADKAPVSVRNFLAYVDSGFYDGVIFHRVIPGFVIQGGGFTAEMVKKTTRAPIKNEADNGLKNRRGTLSLARTQDVNSATSQFFINLQDNAALDHRPGNFGYAVFGKVVKGMDVVDAIAGVPTGRQGYYRDVPTIPVIIKKAWRQGRKGALK